MISILYINLIIDFLFPYFRINKNKCNLAEVNNFIQKRFFVTQKRFFYHFIPLCLKALSNIHSRCYILIM